MDRHAVENEHVSHPERAVSPGAVERIEYLQSSRPHRRLEIINAAPMRPGRHLQAAQLGGQITKWDPSRIRVGSTLNRDEVLVRRRGEGLSLGKDRPPDDAGVRQDRLVKHALEEPRQVGVMLDGVELWQLIHGMVLLHVFRLRFDTESVQVGDRVCQRPVRLDPTSSARDL